MSTDLIGLNYSTDTTGLLTGAAATSGTSATTAAASLKTGTLNTQGSDEANFSKGAAMMQKLSDLKTADPEAFKEAAQQISDSLSEAAQNATDANAASLYGDMASKFASAAKSGDMSSLTPPEPPSGASGAQGQAAQKYSQTASSTAANPMETMDGIISDALSGLDATSA